MKKRLVLSALCALTLGSIALTATSCGKTDEVVEPVAVESVTISNKEEITTDFKAGGDIRRVNLVATPDGANLSEALANKTVFLSTSDEKVVYVTGSYVLPVAVGTATISVNVKVTDAEGKETTKVTDTLDITISAEPIPAKTETKIIGISEVLEKENNKKTSYIIKGKLSSWKSGTDGGDYGNFFLSDLEDDTKSILVYGATASTTALSYNDVNGVYSFKNPKDFKTNAVTSSLKLGDTVYIQGIRSDHNDTKQIIGVVMDNVSNVMSYENSKATAYNVVGKLSKWDGKNTDGSMYGNFYLQDLTDASKEVYVYGATNTASAMTYDEEKAVYKFSNPKDYLTNDFTKGLKIGDIVSMKVFRCDYKGTIEVNGICFASTAA